jgi:hypothetical protein
VVELLDLDNQSNFIYGLDVNVSAQPTGCVPFYDVFLVMQKTACIAPAFSPSISETFHFQFKGSHVPNLPIWHLLVKAIALDWSGNQNPPEAVQDFTITVSQPTAEFTPTTVVAALALLATCFVLQRRRIAKAE